MPQIFPVDAKDVMRNAVDMTFAYVLAPGTNGKAPAAKADSEPAGRPQPTLRADARQPPRANQEAGGDPGVGTYRRSFGRIPIDRRLMPAALQSASEAVGSVGSLGLPSSSKIGPWSTMYAP